MDTDKKYPCDNEFADELFRKYSGTVVRYAQSILHDRAAGEDAAGEVFVNVLRYADKFRDASESEQIRLLTVYTRSVCFNVLKRAKKITFTALEEAEESASEDTVLDGLIEDEEAEALASAVKSLGQPASDMIKMKYYFGMKNREIAEIYEMNALSVGTILHRSLKKLKKQFGGYNYD
ncbi:MAG: sigma-70 family RNA polymerase sigma factor [Clostridia bacterium]|nr:sigma-70 family RNA polymerase sigma factor [Clostridia bacterium]